TLAEQASASALPPQLLSSARQFAASLLSGQLPSAALSPRVFSIMKWVLSTMVLAKLKGKLAIVLVILCAGLGLSGFAATFAGGEPQPSSAGVKAVQRTEVPKRDKQEVKKMTEIEKLQGTWNFATLEVDGAKMPQEAFAGSTIEVAGDRFTTTSGQTIYKGTFKVDAGKTPKTIDLHFTEGPEKGNTTLGMYELDGD